MNRLILLTILLLLMTGCGTIETAIVSQEDPDVTVIRYLEALMNNDDMTAASLVEKWPVDNRAFVVKSQSNGIIKIKDCQIRSVERLQPDKAVVSVRIKTGEEWEPEPMEFYLERENGRWQIQTTYQLEALSGGSSVNP